MKNPTLTRLSTAGLIVLAISMYAGVSHAFPSHTFWHAAASGASGSAGTRPGADGIYYTGGTTDYGMKCSHCHINNKQQQGSVSITVVPTPGWQSVSGSDGYKPGMQYMVTVNLVGAHLGAAMDDQNGMNLTIEDANGAVAGVFTASIGSSSSAAACGTGTAADPKPSGQPTQGQSTVIYGNCHGVLGLEHEADGNARTSWTFSWTAPAAGTGDVTIFVGAVDGDHDGTSSLDDDVAEASIVLKEGA